MSASKSSLGIRLALEDAASPESPFGTAMAMAHQVARQISGSELASHKGLQKRIKPNRLVYMKVCSRRLVLEIIFTWARRHRQTPKCAIMIFSVAPGCMSSRTFSDDNTCIANSEAVPMYPRLTLLIQVIGKWHCRFMVLSKLWARSDEESFIASVHLDTSIHDSWIRRISQDSASWLRYWSCHNLLIVLSPSSDYT